MQAHLCAAVHTVYACVKLILSSLVGREGRGEELANKHDIFRSDFAVVECLTVFACPENLRETGHDVASN